MDKADTTRRLLTEHFERYPKMLIVDIFKFLHQSAFGCEHLVTSLEVAKERIAEELGTLHPQASRDIEALDGEYCRVPLALIKSAAEASALANAFYHSAKAEPDGKDRLEQKLEVARELIVCNQLPFDIAEFDEKVARWREQGFAAVRHSETFRQEYSPVYRVIANKYVGQFNR